MDRGKIDNLICYLLAIANYAKDIHYNCGGASFYGQHLLADRFVDNLYDYIDQLKEICLLGHGIKPAHSSQYLRRGADLIPETVDFRLIKELMLNALQDIENVEGVSKGDENLLGAIAQDIQNNVGLINIMEGEALKNV
jgi:DNA-binding ferritin-like protein